MTLNNNNNNILKTLGVLGSIMVAFFGFWAVQTETCTSQITALQKRVNELEDRSISYFSDKTNLNIDLHKLQFELEKKENRIDIIESYLDKVPTPAWITQKESDGRYRMVFINKAYAERYGISKDKYKNAFDNEVWPHDISSEFKKANDFVTRNKGSLKAVEVVLENGQKVERVFWKFYIKMHDGKDGVGGILAC